MRRARRDLLARAVLRTQRLVDARHDLIGSGPELPVGRAPGRVVIQRLHLRRVKVKRTLVRIVGWNPGKLQVHAIEPRKFHAELERGAHAVHQFRGKAALQDRDRSLWSRLRTGAQLAIDDDVQVGAFQILGGGREVQYLRDLPGKEERYRRAAIGVHLVIRVLGVTDVDDYRRKQPRNTRRSH